MSRLHVANDAVAVPDEVAKAIEEVGEAATMTRRTRVRAYETGPGFSLESLFAGE